jgi:hypothetical protein
MMGSRTNQSYAHGITEKLKTGAKLYFYEFRSVGDTLVNKPGFTTNVAVECGYKEAENEAVRSALDFMYDNRMISMDSVAESDTFVPDSHGSTYPIKYNVTVELN